MESVINLQHLEVVNSMKLLLRGLLVVVGISGAVSVVAAGDPAKGKALFTICATCHGPDGAGNKMLNAPVNAGQKDGTQSVS